MERNDDFKRWVSIAEVDLEDAKVHYKDKKYAYSLYNLQQVNEKLAKAVFIKILFSSEKIEPKLKESFKEYGLNILSPKSYTHKFIIGFLDQIEGVLTSENLDISPNYFSNFKIPDIGKSLERAKEVKEVNGSNSDEIKYIIVHCNKNLNVASDDESKDETSDKLMDMDFEPIISSIEKKSNIKVNISVKQSLKKELLKLTYCIDVFLLLSRILDQFEENRYPNEKDYIGFVPFIPDIYDILVKCFEIVIKFDTSNSGH